MNKRPITSLSGRSSRQHQQISDSKNRKVIDFSHHHNSVLRSRKISISPQPENFRENKEVQSIS